MCRTMSRLAKNFSGYTNLWRINARHEILILNLYTYHRFIQSYYWRILYEKKKNNNDDSLWNFDTDYLTHVTSLYNFIKLQHNWRFTFSLKKNRLTDFSLFFLYEFLHFFTIERKRVARYTWKQLDKNEKSQKYQQPFQYRYTRFYKIYV